MSIFLGAYYLKLCLTGWLLVPPGVVYWIFLASDQLWKCTEHNAEVVAWTCQLLLSKQLLTYTFIIGKIIPNKPFSAKMQNHPILPTYKSLQTLTSSAPSFLNNSCLPRRILLHKLLQLLLRDYTLWHLQKCSTLKFQVLINTCIQNSPVAISITVTRGSAD